MSSALIRKIYRGWDRGESFWDTLGMDENLRVIGDHLPLKITSIGGTRPSGGTEGHCWIDPASGVYSVWSTGIKLEAPVWHEYGAEQALIGYHTATGDMWANTGSAWLNLTQIMKDWVASNTMDESEVLTLLAAALRDGTNTTVTGVGSPSNPYKVNVVSDEIEVIGRAYKHTSVDGTAVVIDPAQFASLDVDNALGIGSDGGLKVLIPVYFEDEVLGGSNAGTVDIELTPTVDPESGVNNYIISANLKVATTTPSGATNALLWSASGFYVNTATDTTKGVTTLAVAANYPSTADDEAATPAYVNALYSSSVNLTNGLNTTLSGAGTPVNPWRYDVAHANDLVKGVSSLAVATNYPSTADDEAATPAYVSNAMSFAVNTAISGATQNLSISGQTLSISGGNSITLPDKDQQTLSSSGQTICISNGNCVTLPEYDNQTLSISGQTLFISNGNSVTLPSASVTTGNVLAATAAATAGLVGTYAWGIYTGSTTIPAGGTLPGSSISQAGGITFLFSGTWRYMGNGNLDNTELAVFLRIS